MRKHPADTFDPIYGEATNIQAERPELKLTASTIENARDCLITVFDQIHFHFPIAKMPDPRCLLESVRFICNHPEDLALIKSNSGGLVLSEVIGHSTLKNILDAFLSPALLT